MSVHEPDGVSESIDELLRIGVMLAARMAEQRVRAREQQLRDAEADSVQAAAAARDEFLRERQGALASLQGVHSDTWWEHADAGDIRHAWLTAREWAGEDPRADRAVWQIADQLKDRYGLDVHTVDPAAFGQRAELPAQATLSDRELGHLDRLLRDRGEELQAERQTASPERAEEIDQRLGEIDGLRGEIDGQLRTRDTGLESVARSTEGRHPGEQRDTQRTIATVGADRPIAGYDSPVRRRQLAERLTAVGLDTETVAAITIADVAQAHPVDEASQASNSPSAAPNRSRAPGRSQTRQVRRRP